MPVDPDVTFAQSNEYCYFMHMEGNYGNARQYVEGLARSGRYFFNSADARDALGVSAEAAKGVILGRHDDVVAACR